MRSAGNVLLCGFSCRAMPLRIAMNDIDLGAYFARIGYDGPADASLETLEALHALHAEKIPFENLSPFLGEPVGLDLASLEGKLVRAGRGGWCFEQNLLLSHMLIALGFNVTRLAARVRWNVPAGVVGARSHMLLRVKLPEGGYIADVGFGGLTLTAPLELRTGVEQRTPHEPHRLSMVDGSYLLAAKVAGEWQALYTFDLHEQQIADYEVSNWYLCNHPQSQFVSGIVAARAAREARHALRNTRYAIHYPDDTTERRYIGSVDEYLETLAGPFRIRVPEGPRLREKLAKMIEANPPP
jgi:N-hydroxyarylamine O-acetyltransferase